MSRADLATRLRAADPLPAPAPLAPPRDVLAQILASPRDAQARRRTSIRHPLLASLAATLLLAGIALGATVSIRYFDGSGARSLPAPVRRALVTASTHFAPSGPLAFDQSVTAYAFSSSDERGTVYMTPFAGKPGFCAALAVAGKPVQASCAGFSTTRLLATSIDGIQPWGLALTPDLHAVLGRLQPDAERDTVRIAFEDGSHVTAARRGRWFAYAVAGDRTQPGHRPVALQVFDGARLVKRITLDPMRFNTLAEARALVPTSNGTRGQNAVRRFLLGGIGSPYQGDGGRFASATTITGTRQIAGIGYPDGQHVSVYSTPVGQIPGWHVPGSIMLALANGSDDAVAVLSGVGGHRQRSFESAGGGVSGIPGHIADQFFFLSGNVPIGVTRVILRTSDGRDHRTHVIPGVAWAWAGRHTGTLRPVRLTGLDANGAVVTTRVLHGPTGSR
ncbi:MAG TPA: hypothetical protein VGF46_02465 [Gaiellales bacterium]